MTIRPQSVTISAFCLSLMMWTGMARAQTDCPFTEADAVPDTLDARGYFPLQVGNVWERVTFTGPFLDHLRQEEVVTDTLIGEDVFYKIQEVIFTQPGNLLPFINADTVYSFKSLVDGSLLQWTRERGRGELTQLVQDFNTCYDLGAQNSAVVVEGGYATTFSFQPGDTISLPSTKEFTFLGLATEDYGYGVGLLQSGGDPDVQTDLTYARLSGQEYGVRLESLFDIRVSIEDAHYEPSGSIRLQVYPNPFSAQATLVFRMPGADSIELEIYNALGQRVRRQALGVMPGGEHQFVMDGTDLSTGMYFVRLVAGSGKKAVHTFVRR